MNPVRISYVIASKRDPAVAECVEWHAIRARVAELSGRGDMLTVPSISRQLREHGRTVIATNADAPGREVYGRTFIVSRVTESVTA